MYDEKDISEADQEVLCELSHNASLYPELVRKNSSKYKVLLRHLIEKHPLKPALWNHLTVVHRCCDEESEMIKLIYETASRFPDYLFGLTGLAMIQIRDGETEKAFLTLKKCQTLPYLYPDRNKFHITEVETFHHTLVHYFCAIGELNAAEVHFNILQKLDCREHILNSAEYALSSCMIRHNLRVGY